MQTTDLTRQPWQLIGWRPYSWMLRHSLAPNSSHPPEVGPISADVPGSVQQALLNAGLIKDWNVGLNSLDCEWVEHRHWEFFSTIEAIPPGTAVRLDCQGLDHSGWVLVDLQIVAEFSGSLIRHRFDFGKHLADGKPHRLAIVIDEPPREQGQIGYTSRSRYFKPRFSYSWDWTPRLVTVGIWDRLSLGLGDAPFEVTKVLTSLDDDHETGRITVWMTVPADRPGAAARFILRDGDEEKLSRVEQLKSGERQIELVVPRVKRWWPNGHGDQPLYELRITRDPAPADAGVEDAFVRQIGFKALRWLPCEGAPAGADPWLCEVNGTSIFLQGVNWTPVRADFHSVSRDDYARLIDLYKAMGVNCVRVWGGAFLEKEDFYDRCDRAGILVWQEFPLSSSAVDNAAPVDAAAIEQLTAIATDYIRRRGHHVCKLLWCGGNELHGEAGKSGGRPHDRTQPAIAALAAVVAREDPGTRFIPTSPSGPSFSGDARSVGKGVHHDVHGPWNFDWPSMDDLRRYWANDDALFRSEVGMPGCSSVETIDRFRGDFSAWPPTRENRLWVHSAAWWIQWDRFKDQVKDLLPEQALPRFVELSQQLQADALAFAAAACKRRFPRCGGFLVWMGHDAFPCPANTAIIDFQSHPKPAYHALANVFVENTKT